MHIDSHMTGIIKGLHENSKVEFSAFLSVDVSGQEKHDSSVERLTMSAQQAVDFFVFARSLVRTQTAYGMCPQLIYTRSDAIVHPFICMFLDVL